MLTHATAVSGCLAPHTHVHRATRPLAALWPLLPVGDEWQPDWGTSQQQEQPPPQASPPLPAAGDEWQHTWNQDDIAAQQQVILICVLRQIS
jgi:hypothetical protein